LENLSANWTHWLNRWHARRSTRAHAASGFQSQPEPRTIGSYARGRQLIVGNFLFSGTLVEDANASLFRLPSAGPGWDEELHGFAWLDDLAAVGDSAARARAQAWLDDWITLYGRGAGPGWTPDLAGRRMIRWINHALFLLYGEGSALSPKYFRSLGQQTIFLSRRWHGAAPGLPRFEALTGLIYAGLSLSGMDAHVIPAMKALARECDEQITVEGGIAARNPEELLEVFTLLNWAASALSESGKMAANSHLAAIERIAPTLRALRHADGALARFHGGGRGQEGRLDQALATSGIKSSPQQGLAMGFVRLHGGRTSLIMDAASPPAKDASANGHASTLAFEVTSGRRPLIVNCGSGATFGPEWRRAGRATPSHSTLCLEGFSSSRLGPAQNIGGHQRELLVDIPHDVRVQFLNEDDSHGLVVGHDGYRHTHGLTHIRRLDLSKDGRALAAEDTLAAIEVEDEKLFDRVMDRSNLQGVGYSIRFHLHPDVLAELDMGGSAVSMVLKSGEIWVFRHDGAATLQLAPSVYLEKGRLKPRATKQVVLSGFAVEYATRIRWTLAKAHETPNAVRDLERDEALPPT